MVIFVGGGNSLLEKIIKFALNNYMNMKLSHVNEIKNKISDCEDPWKKGKTN